MTEIPSKMTVNYNFDLEDDDFFADNFLSSISENDILTSTAISKVISQEPNQYCTETVQSQDLNKQQTITTSKHFDCKIKGNENRDLNNKSENLFSSKPIETQRQDNQVLIVSPLLDSSKEALNVNSRFVPGFTPKARKRKFPGPAGVYTQQNKLQILSCDLEKTSKEKPEEDLDVQDITSSQFTTNDLLLQSWKNLQKDVSSCQTLLSTAKYHSIHRVLNEASKKKLPKYVVVPVLCVLIKKFKPEDSSLVLIDDTGEISGKIYKDVLEEYKELIKVGSALILRKVTYLCNVLLLKKPCIASIYLEDGTVKHICELTSILEKEPLKQMGCECPGTPKAHESGLDSIIKMCDASLNAAAKSAKFSLQRNAAGCSSSIVNTKAPTPSIQTDCHSSGKQSPSCSALSSIQQLPGIAVSNRKSPERISSATKNTSSASLSKSSNKYVNSSCSLAERESPSILSENSHKLGSIPLSNKNSKENEDAFCDDFEMDEFDELLCSLDEKSFLS